MREFSCSLPISPSVLCVTAVLLLGVSSDAWACTCVPPSMRQDFSRADVVFAGRVATFRLVDGWIGLTAVYLRGLWSELTGRPDPYMRKWAEDKRKRVAEFEVNESFKGGLPRRTSVYTGFGNGDCGYDFRTGQEYVVYSHVEMDPFKPAETFLSTGICSGTKHLEDAREELPQLRDKAARRLQRFTRGAIMAS